VTTINISDDPPPAYGPAQLADKNPQANPDERQMEHHALPANWQDVGYDDFLAARRKLMG
jgi:hypothetical protein